MGYIFILLLILTATSFGAELNESPQEPEQASSNTSSKPLEIQYYQPPPLKGNVIFTIGYKLYYVVFNETLNWYQAVAYCLRIGMKLATPDSLDAYTKLKEVLKTKEIMAADKWGLWISLHDLGKTNAYTWLSTGMNTIYHDWSSGEPNHATPFDDNCKEVEHCVNIQLKSGNLGWNDLACCVETNFICEK